MRTQSIGGVVRRAGWPVCGVVALLFVLALVEAPRSSILTTIEINAPPASVWSVLTDVDDFSLWNPTIAELKGQLEKGAVIEHVAGYGADRIVFWPRVLVADKERELRWRGHLWDVPGLLTGEHYFLLRPTANGTLFSQGEHLSGLLLWLFDPKELAPAFEAMNVALAARVEQTNHPKPSP